MKKETKHKKGTTVSLVLGSGGARGLAHIGVIRWLLENNYQIKSITGCSIGSLVGGVYAAGKIDELEKWLLTIQTLDVANLLDFSWGNGGIFKGDKVIKTLVDIIGDIQIEDLPMPFTAVATDLIKEKEVWINTGSLFDAIRASFSLPLLFTPVDHEGRLLIDGGVLNPVPIAPTFNDNTDITIAVNLGGEIQQEITEPETIIEKAKEETTIKQSIMDIIMSFDMKNAISNSKKWGMMEVADKAFDTMQNSISRFKIAAYPPDVEIIIARDACGTLEFDKSAELIELGYNKAQDILG